MGLSFSKQISEALIFLKYQGVVHCAVSSHAVYLVNHSVVKLANFEHAYQSSPASHLHDVNENSCPSIDDQKVFGSPSLEQNNSQPIKVMSKEETIRLAPWIAPEVVIFMQNVGVVCDVVSSPASRSALSESTFERLPLSASDCSPTPAADAYSFARLLQELFDPSCASRFDPQKVRKSEDNTEEDEITHDRSSLLRDMRPVVKTALRRDPLKRAPLEKLHSLIVHLFWGTAAPDASSPDKVNQTRQTAGKTDDRSTAKGTCSLFPISASSPNVPDPHSVKNNNVSILPSASSRTEKTCRQDASTTSGPVASPSTLTKQQYIELAAIPCGPLGSGRSRPLVPWIEPAAPAPSPAASKIDESLSTEDDASSHDCGQRPKSADKADSSGNWIKVAQFSSVSGPASIPRTSRRVWTFLPRHRKRKMKFLIKPASHHTTPTELWTRKTHFGSYLSGARRTSATQKDKQAEGIYSPPSLQAHENMPTVVGGDLCDGLSGMILPAFPEDSSPASASVYQSLSSNVSNSWPPSPSFSAGVEGTLPPLLHQPFVVTW
ncbi:Protein tyrosine kinase [Sparganum proliferum]